MEYPVKISYLVKHKLKYYYSQRTVKSTFLGMSLSMPVPATSRLSVRTQAQDDRAAAYQAERTSAAETAPSV